MESYAQADVIALSGVKVQGFNRRNAKATYVVWKSKDTKEESQSHQGVKEVKVPKVNAKVTIASMKRKTN